MTAEARWWWTRVNDLAVGHQGDVSPEYVEKILTAIEKLPGGLLTALAAAGVYVHLCHRLLDTWSSAPKYLPRGWNGVGWEAVGGFYRISAGVVVVAEEILRDGKTTQEDGDHCVLHELGHALDYTLPDRPSQDPEFRSTYLACRRAVIQAGLAHPLGYFVKPWSAGAIEVFADSVRLLHYPNLWHDDDLFREHFGPCMGHVARYIKELPDA